MLDDVMVIQLTLLVAIHAQRSSENTLNVPIRRSLRMLSSAEKQNTCNQPGRRLEVL